MKDEIENKVLCSGCDAPIKDDSQAICNMGGTPCLADCREDNPKCDMAYCRDCIVADMVFLSTLKQ